jgi:hypothetical protein
MKKQIQTVLELDDDKLLQEMDAITITDEEIDKLIEKIRCSLPIPSGAGGTGATCCGDEGGNPNNLECTTTTQPDQSLGCTSPDLNPNGCA